MCKRYLKEYSALKKNKYTPFYTYEKAVEQADGMPSSSNHFDVVAKSP